MTEQDVQEVQVSAQDQRRSVTLAPDRLRALRPTVEAVLRPWLALHALVGTALVLTLVIHLGDCPRAGDAPGARGLFGWDAGWYRSIADRGYGGSAGEAIRFFPLLPVLGRSVSLLGVPLEVALLGLCSLAALGYLAAVAVLAGTLGDAATARRAPWVAALLPGAAVLALPYTEGVAGLASVGFLLALLKGRGRAGLALGVLAGLARPTGVVLVLPALLTAVLHPERRRPALLSAAGPVLGTATYLAYCGLTGRSALAPYTRQGDDTLRGGLLVNPLPGVLDGPSGGIGTVPTLMLLAGAVALVFLAFRRLPLPVWAWSAAMALLAVSSTEANSLPRYLAGTAPLVVVLAMVELPERRARQALAGVAALSLALTTCWLSGAIVP